MPRTKKKNKPQFANIIHKVIKKERTWLHHEIDIITPIARSIVAVSLLIILLSFFVVGLFFSTSIERESAQAFTDTQQIYSVWVGGSNTMVRGDSVYVDSLLARTDTPFLAFVFEDGILEYTGRVPRYENIFFEVENTSINVRVQAYNSSSLSDCQFLEDNNPNSFLVEIEGEETFENISTVQQPDIEVDIQTILEPRILREARVCLDTIQKGFESLSNQLVQVEILAESILQSPQQLTLREVDKDIDTYVTFYKLCPCDEYPGIPEDASLWLRRHAETRDSSQYIGITAKFDFVPTKTRETVTPDEMTPDNVAEVLKATRGQYNAHLKELRSADGNSLDTIIRIYSEAKQREQDAIIRSQSLAPGLTSSTAPVNSVNSDSSKLPEATPGCFGSDASLSQLYCLMNEYRVQNRRGMLSPNSTMTQAALNHNNWMGATGNFSHSGEGGSRFWNRCEVVGASCSSEILARASFTSASQCMIAWKSSPSHNAALLNPSFSRVGAAIGGGFCTALLH